MSKQTLEARVKALEDKMIAPELPPFWLFCGTEERDTTNTQGASETDEEYRARFVAEGGIIEEMNLFKPFRRYTRECPEGFDLGVGSGR